MNSSLPAGVTDSNRDRQKLRIHRACMLGAGLLVHLTVCWIAFESGYLHISTGGFLLLFGAATALFITFLLLIHFDLNLSFDDPDLALAQMFWAVTVVVVSSYFATDMKAAIVLVGLAMILVGTTRLNRTALFTFALYGILIYLATIAYAVENRPDQIQWLQESIVAVGFSLIIVVGPLLLRYEMTVMEGSLLQRNEQLAAALDKISELASVDELTGSYNRRYLMEFMRHEKAMADRGSYSFTICYIDLDFFKNVNDTFGHSTGDKALCEFTSIAKSVVREADCVARLGGEEFVMVFGGASQSDALLVAERINSLLEDLPISDSQPDYRITASMGITDYQAEEDLQVMLDRADQALYAAKEAGRKRIVVSKPAVEASSV